MQSYIKGSPMLDVQYVPQPQRVDVLSFIQQSSGTQFVIPIYQRNYTWAATKEVKKFLEDFTNILTGKTKRHFLGILVYLGIDIAHNHKEFSIVDGQQRLTTIFLTLYALKHLAEEDKNPDFKNLASELDDLFLTNKYCDDKIKFKLKPLVSDDNVYQKIIEHELKNLDAKDYASNVYKNYTYIKRYISKILAQNYSLHDIYAALKQLYIVYIPLAPDDNAQQIFESINSTGTPLLAIDLIGNYLLMDLDSATQDLLYTKYWHAFEDKLIDASQQEEFVRLFLAAKLYDLPKKNNVYNTFKDWCKQQQTDKESICKLLLEYADYFYDIYINPVIDIESVKYYRKHPSKMPAPFLMEMYKRYKEDVISLDDFNNIVNLVDTYLIRRSLCDKDTSAITRFFPGFLKNVLAQAQERGFDKIFEITKEYLVNRTRNTAMLMPTDDMLQEFLLHNNAYVLESTRIVLDRLETYNNPAAVDLSGLSVEHILPQTPTDYWLSKVPSEDQYDLYSNMIGNLTLAAIPDNSRMHNNNWEAKKAVLSSTRHIKLNESILLLSDWDHNEIKKRTKALIKKISAVYPYQEADTQDDTMYKYLITINGDHKHVRGYLYTDGTVEILAGSDIVNYEDSLGDDRYPDQQELYLKLKEDDIIEPSDTGSVFKQNYIFPSISAAASFVYHGSRNGWTAFKDENNGDLAQIREKLGLKD